jgi:tRNA A37 threonylcarbamoyladenosine dehydratase
MSQPSSSQGTAFAIGLLTGAIVTYILHASYSYQSKKRESPTHHASSSLSVAVELQSMPQKHLQTNGDIHKHGLPPEIRSEMLSRNSLYFSTTTTSSSSSSHTSSSSPSPLPTPSVTGMERITNSSILIVGLGGVGSHTAHMLARAGVQYLRLIDFDQVTLSSLNRHAVATLQDVGLPKATVLCNYLRRICPDENMLVLDPIIKMYTGDRDRDGAILDPPNKKSGRREWDVIIDAIDDVPTKARLIAHCAKRNIRVISCMGAGGKADPTRVHISDLRSASRDPLAASVRQRLRLMGKKEANEEGVKIINGSGVSNGGWLSCIDDDSKLAVVFSSEKVVAKLADITEEQKEEGMHNFGAVDNMRVRVLPVLGTMPAIMGQTLAAMALCELGGKPFAPVCAERVGRNVRHRLYQHLKTREKKFEEKHKSSLRENSSNYTTDGIYIGPIQIDPDDVEYLMAELWKNQCAISGERLGTSLELHRWNKCRPATPNNLVLMSMKSAQKFEDDFEKLGDGRYGVDVNTRRKIEARCRMCVLDAEDVH